MNNALVSSHNENTEQYFLIPSALISPFASLTSSACDLWPREGAGIGADFLRLRACRPAALASFSSRFLLCFYYVFKAHDSCFADNCRSN